MTTITDCVCAVSYTHLDVYKRQLVYLLLLVLVFIYICPVLLWHSGTFHIRAYKAFIINPHEQLLYCSVSYFLVILLIIYVIFTNYKLGIF